MVAVTMTISVTFESEPGEPPPMLSEVGVKVGVGNVDEEVASAIVDMNVKGHKQAFVIGSRELPARGGGKGEVMRRRGGRRAEGGRGASEGKGRRWGGARARRYVYSRATESSVRRARRRMYDIWPWP